MKIKLRRVLAVITALTVIICPLISAGAVQYNTKPVTAADFENDGIYGYVTNGRPDPEKLSSTVVIPGIFQSKTRLYDADGNEARDENGNEYTDVFFTGPADVIVKTALKKALLPLLTAVVTRRDCGGRLAAAVGEILGDVIGGKIASDSRGRLINDIRADKYDTDFSEVSPQDRDFVYSQIPLPDYADIAGADHLYYFSYCSYGNLNETVDELYAFIKKAAGNSPTGKTNIVPVSQGGSLAVNLFERYPDVGQYLDRVLFIVPALDGTVLMGELFADGFINDRKSLYDEIFPVLFDKGDTQWVGYLINILLHILPEDAVKAVLDSALEGIIGKLKYSTCLWGLVDSANYERAAQKHLSGADDAFIRAQTDEHCRAQQRRYENITYQMNTYGVKFFDIVDYNFRMYPLVSSWKKVNSDGIINLESSSLGATSYGVNVKLPDDYRSARGEEYIDSYRILDAGTGLLADTTFYFHNQDHESTVRNDIVVKLAVSLLTDNDFISVDSYPEKYGRFLEECSGNAVANELRGLSSISAEERDDVDRAALEQLIKKSAAFMNNAFRNAEQTETFAKQFEKERHEIVFHDDYVPGGESAGEKAGAVLMQGLTLVLKITGKLLYYFT